LNNLSKLKIILVNSYSRSRQNRISLSVSVRLVGIFEYLRDQDLVQYILVYEDQKNIKNLVEWADVIFLGNGRYVTESTLELIKYANLKNKKTICDIDDYISVFPSYTNHKLPQSTDKILELFSSIQHITVSNAYIHQYLRGLNIDSTILPNCVYVDFYDNDRVNNNIKNKIAFVNTDSIKMLTGKYSFLSALNLFLTKNQHLKIDYFGDPFPELLTLRNVSFIDRVPYEDLLKILINGNYLFAVAPLGGHEEDQATSTYHSYKNPFKYINYGLAKIPCIYSNSQIFNAVIKNGVNGLLTNNTFEDWSSSFDKIYGDPKLRNNIAENALRDIITNFNVYGPSKILLSLLLSK